MRFIKEVIFWVLAGIGATTLLIFIITNNHKDLLARYQTITLTGGTFDLDVTVLITEDTAFALKYVKNNLDSTASSDNFNSRGTTFTSINGGNTIVWLPNTKDKSIIMHELLHATIDIMRRVGVPLNEETEEAYTYELQYLTNELFKQVN